MGNKEATIYKTKKTTLRCLIGCEESQAVCKEFRRLGHEAYSCDILPCSGGHPEWHIQGDVFDVINSREWDLGIFFPPCTKISKAGARWMYAGGNLNEKRYSEGVAAKEFFMALLNCSIEHIAVENPTPLKVLELPVESQVIQPYEYGHEYSKRTLLWLKNLPPLIATKIVKDYTPYLPSNTGGAKRGQRATPKLISQSDSSKTFPGIAKEMAGQWSEYLLNTKEVKMNKYYEQLQLI